MPPSTECELLSASSPQVWSSWAMFTVDGIVYDGDGLEKSNT